MVVYYKCRSCGFRFAKILRFQYYCSIVCKEEYELVIKTRRKNYIREAEEEIENGNIRDTKKTTES